MARVPTGGGGASRRAYHSGYAKGARASSSKVTGGSSVSTPKAPALKAPRASAKSASSYDKAAEAFNVSYGATGFTEEDYNV